MKGGDHPGVLHKKCSQIFGYRQNCPRIVRSEKEKRQGPQPEKSSVNPQASGKGGSEKLWGENGMGRRASSVLG